MPRSRFAQSILLIAGLAIVTYLMISLYLPSSRWLIFGIDKRSGRVRIAEQRVTYLPPYQFFRLKFEKREGYAQRDGMTRITSQEGVPTRVAIFALDGADWELLEELANDGRIPNIKALTQGGVSASLQTIQPTVSSMLWTTVATGLQPDRHGVIDFTDWSRHVPVDS